MKSTYAPLPFSYLSSAGANPRVGLRKDGVYGTSADVPRGYEGKAIPEATLGPSEDPYGVYANGNAILNPRPEENGSRQHPNPMNVYSRQESPYAFRRKQEMAADSKLQPEVDQRSYQRPDAAVYMSKPEGQDVYGNVGLGGPVVWRSHDSDRQPSIERPPTQYPPRAKDVRTGGDDERGGGGGGGASVYGNVGGLDTSNQKPPPVSSAFDNFILVKDPSRMETLPEDSSSIPNDKKSKLQTLFNDNDPKKLPRYDAKSLETTQHNYNSPSNQVNDRQEMEYDRQERSVYLSHQSQQQAVGQPVSLASAKTSDNYGVSNSRLVKDSTPEEDSCCCSCRKRTAVTVSILITAVICLGSGFVIGWFAGLAANPPNHSTPLSLALTNLTNTTASFSSYSSSSSPSSLGSTSTIMTTPTTTTKATTKTQLEANSSTSTRPAGSTSANHATVAGSS